MLQVGVQTCGAVYDSNPEAGFRLMKEAGFTCADFSLNSYLKNTSLYRYELNDFFDKTVTELEKFFSPHKQGAQAAGIWMNQLHMPYPVYIPNGKKEVNDYLRNVVAPKSMEVCAFLGCPYIVMHGLHLSANLGSEEAEWEQTEKFLDFLAPIAKEMGIIICIENLYDIVGGHMVEGPCSHAGKAANRIDRFNEKYHAEILGFCFDTGHANLAGIDFERFIEKLGRRLKVLHIHDNDGVWDLHQIPYTFTRTRENKASTDWEGFIRGLKKIKYDSVLSFETAPVLTAFPNELKMQALTFIAQIGQYFAERIRYSGHYH